MFYSLTDLWWPKLTYIKTTLLKENGFIIGVYGFYSTVRYLSSLAQTRKCEDRIGDVQDPVCENDQDCDILTMEDIHVNALANETTVNPIAEKEMEKIANFMCRCAKGNKENDTHSGALSLVRALELHQIQRPPPATTWHDHWLITTAQ